MASLKRFVALGLVAMLLGGLLPMTSLAAIDTTSTISVTRRTEVFNPATRTAIFEYNVQGPAAASGIILRIYEFVPTTDATKKCETPSDKLALTFGPSTRTPGTYSENWNGNDKNGVRVDQGTYCFDLRWANPPTNARGYIQETITVTNNPATAYSEAPAQPAGGTAQPAGAAPFTVIADPSVIVPTATAGNAVRISYNVNEPLPNGYSLKIEDSGGRVVATLVDQNTLVNQGVQSTIPWNGRYNNGVVVPAGDYYFRFHVNGKNDLIGLIRVENPNTAVPTADIVHYVDPAIINPTLANPIDATIRYTVNRRITTGLSIAIRDGANTVKLLKATNNPIEVGTPPPAVWDGRYNNGVIVPSKTYTYVFISNGQVIGQGSIAVSYTTAPPPPPASFITSHNANPSTIVQGQSSVISYTIGKNVTNFRLSVRNQSGTINETLVSSPSQVAGSYTQIWSGRFQNGAVIADAGTYTYVLEATNETPVTGTVVVSTQSQSAVVITDLGPSFPSFNPLAGGTVFRYQLTQDARVDLTVLSGTTIVRRLLVAGFSNNGFAAGSNNTGVNNVPWDGRNDAGVILPDGSYTYVIAATNANGPAQPKSGTVVLSSTVPLMLDVNSPIADPNPYNPDTQLNLQLKFNLVSISPAYVTVTVTRQDTRAFVKTVTSNQLFNPGTNLAVPWNATDSNNSIVPAGVYDFRVDAGFGPNQITDTATGSVTINRGGVQSGSLDITNVYADPTPFNPELRRTYFTFTINKAAQITATVTRRSDGTFIKTVTSNQLYDPGVNRQVAWDGTDLNNSYVPSGEYNFRIDARQAPNVGFEQDYEVGRVTVDRSVSGSLQITDNGAFPNPFNPRTTAVTQISFSVNQIPNTVTVRIYKDNVFVRELPVTTITQYYYRADFDGRAFGSGSVVDIGTYTYRIDVTAGGQTATRSNTLVVSNSDQTGSCGNFTDVPKNHYLCPALEFVKSRGIFTGYTGTGAIGLDNVIQRAELLAVVRRAFGFTLDSYNASADGDLGYPDLRNKTGEWYMPYLKTFSRLGLMVGYPDGRMRPEQTMNTAELYLVFLKSAKNAPNNIDHFVIEDTVRTAPYKDVPLAHRWYLKYAAFAKLNDLVTGDRFYGARGITRAQVIQLIYDTYRKGLITYGPAL